MPLLGFDTSVNATVSVDGTTLDNVAAVRIAQRTGWDHHTFSVHLGVDLSRASKTLSDFLSEDQGKQGKSVNINFAYGPDGAEAMQFKGIITEVRLEGGDDLQPLVVLAGASPTILMDGMPKRQVFQQMKPSEVIRQVCSQYPGNDVNLTTNTLVDDETMEYCVQYDETDFDFIHRLAAANGNWLYYDGKDILLGAPQGDASIGVISGHTLSGFKIGLSAQPFKTKVVGYDYTSPDDPREEQLSASTSISSNVSSISQTASKSADMFGEGLDYLGGSGDQAATLATRKKSLEAAAAARMGYFTGRITDPRLRVGAAIEVQNENGEAVYGSYIVTGLVGHLAGTGLYSSDVQAVPGGTAMPTQQPPPDPQAEPQVAVVTDNADPDGLGRVKIKFAWAPDADTPWLRQTLPHAGGKYGFLFVPEVGDAVMVDFENSDPDRPFIVGALYTGTANQNDKYQKGDLYHNIRTKAGNEISFSDSSGSEEIIIKAKDSENYISISMSGDKILISSVKEIELKSEAIKLTAQKDVTITGLNVETKAQSNIKMEATGNLEAKGTAGVKIESPANVKVAGTQVEVSGTATAKVTGAQASLEGQAQAVVKAAIVMIN